MTVEYDPARENGSRVISVKVGESPLDEDRLYTVATNNYVAVSKYYPQLAEADEVGEFCACDEALIEFFKQESSVIEAAVNRRGITAVSHTPDTSVAVDMTAVWAAYAAAAVMAGTIIGKKISRK